MFCPYSASAVCASVATAKDTCAALCVSLTETAFGFVSLTSFISQTRGVRAVFFTCRFRCKRRRLQGLHDGHFRRECVFIRAEGYLACRVVTKGIKADCKRFMRTYSAKRWVL